MGLTCGLISYDLMQFRQLIIRSLFVLGALATASTSYGWNKATHMAIGAIAYQDLRANAPQTLARVVAILKQHPDFQPRWASKLADTTLTTNERDEYLLMLAARWPDDVKEKNNPYDHSTWHYVNYYYNPALGIARTDSIMPTGENILQAFTANREILRSNAPDSAKAIALCWIFHLAGDIHMPLHTVSMVSEQFPEGDKGGNQFKIKVTPDDKTINLHGFWDGMLLGADDFRSADQLAIQLRHDIPRDLLSQLNPLGDLPAWSTESFKLAQEVAYRDGKLTAGTADDGAVLPTDYIPTVKPVAEQQVVLSGYRLADVLKADVTP